MCKIPNPPNCMHSYDIHYFSREPPRVGKWCHWDKGELKILTRFLLIGWTSSPYPSQSIHHMKCIKYTFLLQRYMKCIIHMLHQEDTCNESDQSNKWDALSIWFYMIYNSNTFSTRMHEVSPRYFSNKVHELSLWYFTKVPFKQRYLIYHMDTLARYFQ